MKERGILFSGRLVRAILAGRKSQTRRVLGNRDWVPASGGFTPAPTSRQYGEAGDRLYVREAWRTVESLDELRPVQLAETVPIRYEADGAERGKFREPVGRYRHGRFMPRWASRITLEVTDVRVQRLQDITAEDALAEGVELGVPLDVIANGERSKAVYFDARVAFAHLWCGVNGPDAWKANPWVWVIEFKRVADASKEAA